MVGGAEIKSAAAAASFTIEFELVPVPRLSLCTSFVSEIGV